MFYSVNLATGAARLIGAIGGGQTIQGIAIGGFPRAAGFDVCIQDDRTGDTLQFDSCSGDFQFSKCGSRGFSLTGRGQVIRLGNVLTLRADRVFALLNVNSNSSLRSGIAVFRNGRTFVINDRDVTNNTCSCR
jgi:hypothetical protein